MRHFELLCIYKQRLPPYTSKNGLLLEVQGQAIGNNESAKTVACLINIRENSFSICPISEIGTTTFNGSYSLKSLSLCLSFSLPLLPPQLNCFQKSPWIKQNLESCCVRTHSYSYHEWGFCIIASAVRIRMLLTQGQEH